MKPTFSLLTRKQSIVIASGVALLTLVAWSPPTGEDVLVTNGVIQVRATTSTANITSNSAALVVGSSNDITNSNSASDRGRGIVAGSSNKLICPAGSTGYGGVIGNSNNVWGRSLLVVGSTNTVSVNAASDADSANFSIVGGYNNTINKDSTSSLVTGSTNTIYADNSLVAGWNNDITGPTVGSSAWHSAAIGYYNGVHATHGWALGYTNQVLADKGVAIGTGTQANNVESIAIGRYNSPMVTGDVLAVGTGSSSTATHTALRVTADGSVILGRAQGDISMGIYQ